MVALGFRRGVYIFYPPFVDRLTISVVVCNRRHLRIQSDMVGDPFAYHKTSDLTLLLGPFVLCLGAFG